MPRWEPIDLSNWSPTFSLGIETLRVVQVQRLETTDWCCCESQIATCMIISATFFHQILQYMDWLDLNLCHIDLIHFLRLHPETARHWRSDSVSNVCNGCPIFPPVQMDVTMPRLFWQGLAVHWRNYVSSTACFAAETFAGVWHLLWQTYSAHRGTSAKDWSAWHIICKTATYVLITSPVQAQLPAGRKNGMINFCIFTWTWEHLRGNRFRHILPMDARNKFQTLIQVRTCSAVQSHGQIESCCENRRTLGRSAFIFPSFLFRPRL